MLIQGYLFVMFVLDAGIFATWAEQAISVIDDETRPECRQVRESKCQSTAGD
jgi:hypothetical protein